MEKKPDLSSAYALRGPKDARRLYADWAQSYDKSFAQDMGYRLPAEVARVYAGLGGGGPVLDLGAGTGLVGQHLAALGISPVDGTDISPEMLAQAETKNVYRRLFEGDITAKLDTPDGTYEGCTSAGTFTHGHVGPEAIGEVMRVLRPGGWAVLSVNAQHWAAMGFEAELARLAPMIAERREEDIAIYDAADSDRSADRAWLLMLRRL